ncbi:MAG: hypothetical protein Kow0037_11270 [Calditrichia bacterium]
MVYRAYDELLERDLAIKLIEGDAELAEKAIKEAQITSKISHPAVVTIYEIGKHQGNYYIAMELLTGVNGVELLKREKRLPWPTVLKYMITISEALEKAHSLNIIHKDIKLENLIFDLSAGRVKLLDFGIAADSSAEYSENEIEGTLLYASPEQILGQAVTPASDLYSLGIVIYKLITGEFPFLGDSDTEILFNKLNSVPASLNEFVPNIPARLAAFLLKCLETEPEKRWGSAAEFRNEMENILMQLDAGETPDSVKNLENEIAEETDVFEENLFKRNVFIGREHEIAYLNRKWKAVQTGKSKIVIIRGEAGVGKTTLLRNIGDKIFSKEGWVLYGACLYQEGMSSYLPFLQSLSTFLKSDLPNLSPNLKNKIVAQIRENSPALLDLILPEENLTLDDSRSERKNSDWQEGILNLLLMLGEIKPVVIILDDLQWADHATVSLLKKLAEKLEENRIFLVGLIRSEQHDVESDGTPGYVRQIIDALLNENIAEEFQLNCFNEDECELFIDKLFVKTRFSEVFYDKVYRETRGNPFFIVETVQQLMNDKIIYSKNSYWYDDTSRLKIDVPHRVEDVLVRRLALLSEEEREILQAAAVVGYKFEPELLADILNYRISDLLQILNPILVNNNVIIRENETYFFEHPLLREVLYQEMPAGFRKEFHSAAAEQLKNKGEEGSDKYAGEIAEHLRQSEKFEKAMHYYWKAVENTFRLGAYDECRYYLETMEKFHREFGVAWPSGCSEREVYFKLGICYDELGLWEESLHAYDEMYNKSLMTNDQKYQVNALIRVGSLMIRMGNWEHAIKKFESCLLEAGKLNDSLTQSKCYNNLGVCAFQMGNVDEAISFFKKTLEFSTTEGCQYDVANALTNLGSLYNMQGNPKEALKYYGEAKRIYAAKNDSKRLAQLVHNMGMAFTEMEELEKAKSSFEECFEIAREIGDKSMEALTNLNIAKVFLHLDDLDTARGHLEKALRFFKRASDWLGMAETYSLYALLFLKQRDFQRARKFVTESISINEKKNFLEGLAENYETLAEIDRKEGQFEQMILNYHKAIDYFNKIGAEKRVKKIMEKLQEYGRLDQNDTGRIEL